MLLHVQVSTPLLLRLLDADPEAHAATASRGRPEAPELAARQHSCHFHECGPTLAITRPHSPPSFLLIPQRQRSTLAAGFLQKKHALSLHTRASVATLDGIATLEAHTPAVPHSLPPGTIGRGSCSTLVQSNGLFGSVAPHSQHQKNRNMAKNINHLITKSFDDI